MFIKLLKWLCGDFDTHYPPTKNSPNPDEEPLVIHGQGDYRVEIYTEDIE